MQTLTEKVSALRPPGGLFDDTVVRNLFAGATAGARKALVHRAVSSREVLRLKRGLYCLSEVHRRSHPHPFAVAGMLHHPSHISMESALWHHGLIPESVHVITSVTSRRSRSFVNPLGEFNFTRVPSKHPRAGVEAVEVAGGMWAFVATSLRAIADTVYTRTNVTWQRDGIGFLTESLRIDEDDLIELNWEGLPDILLGIRNKRTRDYLSALNRELHR